MAITVNVSPNMMLPVPVPTVDPGPDWANNLYACLYSQIDAHDHSAGKGVQIQPDGLDISGNLTFQGNSATNLLTSSYSTQSAPLSTATYPYAVYVSGGNLYYNSASTAIQITTPTAVNATSSGISSPPASASFVSGTLVVNENTNTPGNIAVGSVEIGANVAGSDYITISSPSSTSSYTITLPVALPTSTALVTETTSGQMSYVYPDGNTIVISAGELEVPAGGITTTQLENGSVTRIKEAAVGQTVSSSSGTFSTTSTTPVQVTNLSNGYTVSSSARPVVILVQADGTGNISSLTVTSSTAGVTPIGYFYIVRDGSTVLAKHEVAASTVEGGTVGNAFIPSSALYHLDTTATSGSHTYSIQVQAFASSISVGIENSVLVTYEL
jgi:hypothetical protein